MPRGLSPGNSRQLKHRYRNSQRSAVIKFPGDVVGNYKSPLADRVKERSVVFWLDTAGKVPGFDLVSDGTLDASLVHRRTAFHHLLDSLEILGEPFRICPPSLHERFMARDHVQDVVEVMSLSPRQESTPAQAFVIERAAPRTASPPFHR